MYDMEFIKYEATPTEKHLGIATIKLYGKIVLRYKIVPTKDGTGYFPASASYKVTKDGEEFYLPAFVIDSRSEEEEISRFVRQEVKKQMKVTSVGEECPF